MSEWTEQHQLRARAEGWSMHKIVDNGKPLKSWYYQIFGESMKRDLAVQFVMAHAKARSEFHIHALQVCAASKIRSGK